MSATAGHAGPEQTAPAVDVGEARALTPAEIAWVVLLPCAIAMVAAIVLLGPPLGHLLVRPSSDALWPPTWWEARGSPEPVEYGRYALAVLAPAVLAAAILATVRRAPALRPGTIRALVLAGQSLVLAVVVVAVLAQHGAILVDQPPRENQPQREIFGVAALAAAALLLTAALLALRQRAVVAWCAGLARETSRRRAVGLAIAVVIAAIWLLQTITTDRLSEDLGQFNWTMNDAFAVLNGRTPLVDYHIIYGKLIPYPTALALAVFGETGLVYTLTLAVMSVLALVAVYAIFRRVVRSSLLALGLFVPFVAASDVQHTMTISAMWPMRYGGAYLVAWLTARRIDRRAERHGWVLFLVGGVVAINALEFGLGAVVASIAALLCARPPRSRQAALRLARDVVGGILGAVALVSLVTLLHAGTLPQLDNLLQWQRIFGNLGWFSLPIPTASLHLVVYATFVAAIGTAVVRIARAADDVLLTSMLVWSGTFGLIAGSYYTGRSEDLKLLCMLSAWAFALALLTVVCVRALAARSWRSPTLAELLVLFGFAAAVCSIAWVPLPHSQFARITRAMPDPVYRADATSFLGRRTRTGEKVIVLLPEGYRIAHALGLDNVAPYGFPNAIVTVSQMRELIATAHREQIRRIFLPRPGVQLAHEGQTAQEQLEALLASGYRATAEWAGFLELTAR
ncbi:MAG TPA: hypothetical protein VK506_13205 [Conexibacter sp.]|nr:hypothetical protein [Conexibacter sp.]